MPMGGCAPEEGMRTYPKTGSGVFGLNINSGHPIELFIRHIRKTIIYTLCFGTMKVLQITLKS